MGIWWAGRKSRRDRQVLLAIFRPGTYAVIGLTLAIVLVNTALFIGALLYIRLFCPIDYFCRDRRSIAIVQIIRLLLSFQKEKPLKWMGKDSTTIKCRGSGNSLVPVVAVVGTEPPVNIIAGITPTFFVTETPVLAGEKDFQGRSLYLSVPLCRTLTENELKSIIGHELAHFHGQDTEFSRRFYPLYRRGANTLQVVSDTARSVGGGGWALVPAIWLLSLYLESFSTAEAQISREREIAADAIGAGISGAREFVALTKIIRF